MNMYFNGDLTVNLQKIAYKRDQYITCKNWLTAIKYELQLANSYIKTFKYCFKKIKMTYK